MEHLLLLTFTVLGLFDSIPQIDVIALVILIILGIIIIMLIRLLIMLIPAVLFAVIIWLFTGSVFWAGIVFLVIAALSVLKKL